MARGCRRCMEQPPTQSEAVEEDRPQSRDLAIVEADPLQASRLQRMLLVSTVETVNQLQSIKSR